MKPVYRYLSYFIFGLHAFEKAGFEKKMVEENVYNPAMQGYIQSFKCVLIRHPDCTPYREL